MTVKVRGSVVLFYRRGRRLKGLRRFQEQQPSAFTVNQRQLLLGDLQRTTSREVSSPLVSVEQCGQRRQRRAHHRGPLTVTQP